MTSKCARCLARSAHSHMRNLLQGAKSESHVESIHITKKSTRRISASVADNIPQASASHSGHDEAGTSVCKDEIQSQTALVECGTVCVAIVSECGNCSCDESHSDHDQCVDHQDGSSQAANEEQAILSLPDPSTPPMAIYKSRLNSFTLNSGNPSHDLKRFLQVVGTEPKEARYWFKYFQKMTNSNPLFAVIQIEEDLIRVSELIHRPASGRYDLDVDSPLNELCSYLGFLHRHDMKCIVIHGRSAEADISRAGIEDLQNHIIQDGQLITDLLEKNGAQTRLLSIPPIQVTQTGSEAAWTISKIDPVALNWAQKYGSIPVLSNIALTTNRQLINIDLFQTTSAVSKMMLPLKVLIVNLEGGITDLDGKVIPNINLPHEESAVLRSPWCTLQVEQKIHDVTGLLMSIHSEQLRLGRAPDSAVILTAASTLLTELFTHYGSGTFFKIAEKINMFRSFDEVDTKRLVDLIHMTFQKDLKNNFVDSIEKTIDAVFISEGYSAAVIVTREPGICVPYLDKFVVRKDHQDNAVGRMLWDHVRHTYPQLFWRSRNTNLINPWYFKRSDGCWSDGEWTVFWYGVKKHKQTSELIDYALSKSNSFQAPDPSSSGIIKAKSSSWSALQYTSNT